MVFGCGNWLKWWRIGRRLAHWHAVDRLGSTYDLTESGARFESLEPRLLLNATLTGNVFNDLDGDGLRGGGESGLPGVEVFLDINENGSRDEDLLIVRSAELSDPINDQTPTLVSTLTVQGLVGDITDLNVTIDITHTSNSDLSVSLISPANTRVELFSEVGAAIFSVGLAAANELDNLVVSDDLRQAFENNGIALGPANVTVHAVGKVWAIADLTDLFTPYTVTKEGNMLNISVGTDGNDFTLTTLDDDVGTSIISGFPNAVPPFPGHFVPASILALANFEGEDPNGNWMLEITDSDPAANDGTLNFWSLTIRGVSERTTQTGADGGYQLTDVAAGDYVIAPETPLKFFPTTPTSLNVSLADDQMQQDVDFGYRQVFGGDGAIIGTKFDDVNNDGIRGGDDSAMSGVAIYLDLNNNSVLDAATAIYRSSDTEKVVRGFTTATSTLGVAGVPGRLFDVDVNLDIVHSLTAEVDVFLSSPAGTRIKLFDDVGGNASNFVKTTIDDEANTRIDTRRAPFVGSFQPEFDSDNPMALFDFDGEDPNGVWTLEVTDDGRVGSGRLAGWALSLTFALEPVTNTVADGTYLFDGLIGGDYVVAEVMPDGLGRTAPGGNGTHQVTLTGGQTATGLDFGNRLVVGQISGSKFSDANANGERDSGERGVEGFVIFLDQNGDRQLQTDTVTLFSSNVPMSIPEFLPPFPSGSIPLASETVVDGAGQTLLDVNVTLNITHPSVTDLQVRLISPAGTTVELFDGVGLLATNKADIQNLTLDDEASLTINDDNPPFADSTLRAESRLAVLNGEDPNGVWTLELIDETLEHVGVLNDWALTLLVATEPAVLTDENGDFTFTDLDPGSHVVVEQPQVNFTPTFPGRGPDGLIGIHEVTLDAGQAIAGILFGNFAEPVTLEGIKWNDLDGDGKRDAGEPGMNGVVIELVDRATGQVVATQITQTVMLEQALPGPEGEVVLIEADGFYRFENVTPGEYDLREVVPDGFVPTFPTVSWADPITLDAGDRANSVTAGDLNYDGRSDLVVTNREADTLFVFLNEGNGVFGAPVTIDVGDGPNGLAIGDFNNDGIVDMATSNGNSFSVSVLFGNGDGTFQPFQEFLVDTRSDPNLSFPNSVSAADIDGDGDTDLAVADITLSANSPDTISVLLNNGDGTFADPVASPTGDFPRSMQFGDFDGDGLPDAVMGSFLDPKFTVHVNNGDGTFREGQTFELGVPGRTRAVFVDIADFDGDGLLDLTMALDGIPVVFVALNSGDGTFARPRGVAVFTGDFVVIAAGDIDGDGVADLAVTEPESDQVSIFRNRGNATFDPPVVAPTGEGPVRLDVGDFDGDGLGDVAVLNSTETGRESISVLLNRAGTFRLSLDAAEVRKDLNFGAFGMAAISGQKFLDRNKDGQRQISDPALDGFVIQLFDSRGELVAEQVTAGIDINGNGRIDPRTEQGRYLFEGLGPDSYLLQGVLQEGFEQTLPLVNSFDLPLLFDAGAVPTAIAAADFNEDGYIDLAVTNRDGDDVSLLFGKGNGRFLLPENVSVGDGPTALVAGDFNGDQLTDLAVANGLSDGVSILLSSGAGSFAPALDVAVGDFPGAIGQGDFDRDGDLDLVVANFGSNDLMVLGNNGAGAFTPGVPIGLDGDPIGLVVVDLDQDDDLDVAVTNFSAQTVSVLVNNGDGTFTQGGALSSKRFPSGIAAADLDGDLDQDLVVANLGSRHVSVFANDGGGIFLPAKRLVITSDSAGSFEPRSVLARDLDGDGDADLAVVSRGTSEVAVLFNITEGGPLTFADPMLFEAGSGPVALVAADFDADDAVDLAIANQSSNRVGVLLNTEGQYVVNPTSGQFADGRDFGNFTDLPDLVATFVAPPSAGTHVPGDRLRMPVNVTNISNGPAIGEATINLFASEDAIFDGEDFLVASIEDLPINLALGQSRRVVFNTDFDGRLPPGNYHFILVVEAAFAELRPANNLLVSDQSFDYVFGFGQVGARSNVKLVLEDDDGSVVTYRVPGAGTGTIMMNGGRTELELAGTRPGTNVIIRVRGGDGRTVLHNVILRDPMNHFKARRVDLLGDLTADSLKALTLGDVAGQRTIVIGQPQRPNDAVAIRLGRVQDFGINSETQIRLLSVIDWRDLIGTRDQLFTPALGLVRTTGERRANVEGNFEADILLSGAGDRRFVLRQALIAGSLVGANWVMNGDGGSVNVRGAVDNSSIRATGSLNVLVATSISGSTLFAGVAEQVAGLPTEAAEFVNPQATIRRIVVRGVRGSDEPSLTDSNIASASLRSVTLQRVQGQNDGKRYGLATIDSGLYTRIDRRGPADPGFLDQDGDYEFRLIENI